MKKDGLTKREKAKIKKIHEGIKSVKIQGATNVAKAALEAYILNPSIEEKEKLIGLRTTEPMLTNAINFVGKIPNEEIIRHFGYAQRKIDKSVYKLLKKHKVVFTHCHSTNVVKALIYSKNRGLRFEVYNTETRPLYQGRQTARELNNAGIKVTTFIDSGLHEALEKTDIVLVGADAILRDGVINKIGSELIAVVSFLRKIPMYVVADSWKFSPKNVKIEERDFKEVWEGNSKGIKVRNPAFEKFDKKYIKGIVSELGVLDFEKFVKKIDKVF